MTAESPDLPNAAVCTNVSLSVLAARDGSASSFVRVRARTDAKAGLMRTAPDSKEVDASIEALERRWTDPETTAGIEAFFARTPAHWVVE